MMICFLEARAAPELRLAMAPQRAVPGRTVAKVGFLGPFFVGSWNEKLWKVMPPQLAPKLAAEFLVDCYTNLEMAWRHHVAPRFSEMKGPGRHIAPRLETRIDELEAALGLSFEER